MEKWLVAALAALIIWGVWGVVLKKASARLEWFQVYIFSNSIILIFILLIGIYYKSHIIDVDPKSIGIAALAGLLGTLGYLLLIASLAWGGKASLVITLTGLYPAVTAVLSYIVLGEEVTIRKALGIILALIAIILISS